LTRIQQLRRGLPTAVRVTGYWNVFLDGQVADTTYGPAFQQLSAALTRRVNSLIQQAAQAHAMTYIDLYTVFKGRAGTNDDTPLLAADGDHPSQAGDREIARALAAAGYAPVWNRN
jgi:lysophospholipase L1-like esterase